MTTTLGSLPELRAAEARLHAAATAAGLDFKIADFGGVRTAEETALIMQYRDADYAVYVKEFTQKYGTTHPPLAKSVWRPINEFGSSHHNYGAAFDVVMLSGSIAALGALAPSVGLRWGGTFSTPDTPHFQLPITLNEASARSEQSGVAPVRRVTATGSAAGTAVVNSPTESTTTFDLSSAYAEDRMPKTPSVQFYMYRPAFDSRGLAYQPNEKFVPGEHALLQHVSLESFEYVDPWAAFDEVTMVFSDPEFELANFVGMKEGETRLVFSFGYDDMMAPARQMIFYRCEMDFPESGRITTKLMFFSAGIELGLVYKNRVITSQTIGLPKGLKITISQVAEHIAREYGLTPVIEQDDGESADTTWTINDRQIIDWLNEKVKYVKSKETGQTGYLAQVRNHELRVTTRQYNKVEEHVFTYRGKDPIVRAFRPSFPADLQRGGMWLANFSGYDPATGALTESGSAAKSMQEGKPVPGSNEKDVQTTARTNEQKDVDKAPTVSLKDRRAKRDSQRSDIETTKHNLEQERDTIFQRVDETTKLPVPIAIRRQDYQNATKQIAELERQLQAISFEQRLEDSEASGGLGKAKGLGHMYGADFITSAFNDVFKNAESKTNISATLLKAIASQTSGFNKFYQPDYTTVNPISGKKEDALYGMMLIRATDAYGYRTNPQYAFYYNADLVVRPYNVVGTPDSQYITANNYSAAAFPRLAQDHQANVNLAAAILSSHLGNIDRAVGQHVIGDRRIEYALSMYKDGVAGDAWEPIRTPKFIQGFTDATVLKGVDGRPVESYYNHNPNDPLANQSSFVDPVMRAWKFFKDKSTDLDQNSFATDPNTGPNTANMQNAAETSIQLAMTAGLDLWGYPLIATGQPIRLEGVPTRFSDRWFVKEVKHKIDRASGFTTSCDLSRYPPGGSENNTNRGPQSGSPDGPLMQTMARTNEVSAVKPKSNDNRAKGEQKPRENLNGSGQMPGMR